VPEQRKKRPGETAFHKYILPSELSEANTKYWVLENGLRVINEKITGASSVGIGLWIEAGSVHEEPRLNGMSHFIEHVAFKGTKRRSMYEIMSSIESRGGMLNAFTTKEHTCYYGWTRPKYLDEATQVLGELVFHPTFGDADIRREKSVIAEEIRGLDDEPDELVFDLFEEKLFGEHPLSRPVIGNEKAVASLKKKDVITFHKEHYTPAKIVAVFSGNVSHPDALRLAKKYFSVKGKQKRKASDDTAPPLGKKAYRIVKGKAGLSQSHIIIGNRSYGFDSPKLPALGALITLLGVGMGSRLNLKLREELGLAYETMAFHSPYANTGCTGIYAAVKDTNTERSVDVIFSIIKDLFRKPVTKAELEQTKEQMIGSIVLSMESVTTRLMRTGSNELSYRRIVSLQEEIGKIASLKLDDISAVAEEIFRDEKALSVVSITSKNRVKILKEYLK
jgi:predicted Zn-dependent peptidase